MNMELLDKLRKLNETLDDTRPHNYDAAPGTPGNTVAQEMRQVKTIVKAIIEVLTNA